MTNVLPIFLAGEWIQGEGDHIEVVNPANGQTVAVVAESSPQQVDKAIASARSAVLENVWFGLKPHERAAYLHRMSDLIEAQSEQFALDQMSSNGKTLAECRAQVQNAATCFRYYAAVCETAESSVTPSRGDYLTMTAYEPMGVVLAITPWNSPLTLEAQKLAPALAAGNAVVLKPSEVTPLVALRYGLIAQEAGLPKGVLSVLPGRGRSVGTQLLSHPGIDMVSFTGGTRTGRHIAEVAASRFIPTSLELGGKSPNIVFADADMDLAVSGVMYGIFSGAGQSCVAGSRIFVERSAYSNFKHRLLEASRQLKLGPPDNPHTDIGPLSSFAHRETVVSFVEAAKAEGGQVLIGGGVPEDPILRRGAYFEPTLIDELKHSARAVQEEIFGPIACLLPFDDDEDLVAMANGTDFGLAAGIWTSDYRRALSLTGRIRAGTVWINTYKQLSITTPFGGVGSSGWGREKGIQGMRAYMQEKSIYIGLSKTPMRN